MYFDCDNLINHDFAGEVLKNLRFSLGPITGEVLQHLSACSRDIAAEVRAAAVMVLTMMLQGRFES